MYELDFSSEGPHLKEYDGPYTPGDYRRFYDDPRTRAKYQQWAPLLLPAEDHLAAKEQET